MTADERQVAEQFGDWLHTYLIKHGLTDFAIDAIAAARRRWQNEALEEAAKGPSDCKCNACQLWREHLRALKK